MLVDELLALKRGPLVDQIKGGLDDFKRDLRQAQHFVLDSSLAREADLMPQTEVLRVLDFCKVPFPLTWVEFTHLDRPLFSRVQRGSLQAHEAIPSRVGILAERIAKEPETVRATLCWTNKLYGPNIGVVEVEICPQAVSSSLQSNGDFLALQRLSPYYRQLTVAGHTEAEAKAAAGALIERGKGDWRGEAWFWMKVLALLNAKNGATSEVISHEKLNRVRRRMDKPPLIDYHILKLRLDGARRRGEAATADSPAHDPMRAHVVRGHFKVRKTGMYWWAPHVRGDLSRGFAAKRYAVSATASHNI